MTQERSLSEQSSITRRTLLRGAAGLGLTAMAAPLLSACGSDDDELETKAPPETPTIRIPKVALTSAIATAVAADFLKEEGFTDVQYITLPNPAEIFAKAANGELDMVFLPTSLMIPRIEAGDRIVALAGINAGCFQVVASPAVKSLSDCRGKRLASSARGAPDDLFLELTLRSVGIDMRKENTVSTHSHETAVPALLAGEIDAMVSYPPLVSRLRTDPGSHLILDANVDRPWSQYIFAMAMVHRDFLTKYPVATKRALRDILKGADVVAKEPERAVQALKAQGFIPDALYAPTLSELPQIPYNVWRTHDPADSLRFYALRLKEAGLVKSTPEQIIAQGTDFRFLHDLRRELKES
jgi:NitT/TauT family transport system substrate-binding protein